MATLGQAPSAPTAHTTDLAPECSCVQRAPPGAGSLERSPHELDQTGQLPGSLGWPFRGELNVLVTSATVQLWSVQPRALRYACTHTQAHTCTHRCMHTRAHEQIHARLCTLARCVHMSTRMHARMCARAHRHMHTHTRTRRRGPVLLQQETPLQRRQRPRRTGAPARHSATQLVRDAPAVSRQHGEAP